VVASEILADGSRKDLPSDPGTPVLGPTAENDMRQMMVNVVEHGTGSNARIPGVKVAGKTGTAQTGNNKPAIAWFVSFAPADNPQVAVAVVVEDAPSYSDFISGNGLAAPVARAVMRAVLG